jgi:5'-deoxynucleotidase YfbR-like HD superfamily hydrolase
MKLNLKQIKGVNEVIKRLNILRRWTCVQSSTKYNELGKQALNCIVAYMLACYSEEAGNTVHWERFPKIALYRAFQKAYVYFDTPEYIISEVCAIGGISKDAFNVATKELIAENTDEEFANFLSDVVGTDELKIYRAATKIATLVELIENTDSISRYDYLVDSQEIYRSLEEFEDIPGVLELKDMRSNVFKVIQTISTLRNKNRWAAQAYVISCPVLGHLFDTAIFAYFMALEQNPQDEVNAAKMFFMGIFHDVAETWTTDIPSPIKDRIKGFREATEQYELSKLESELYKQVPDFLAKKLQEVMFETEANKECKKLIKGADYLSADSECWRQMVAGSRDKYFRIAIEGRLEKIKACNVLLTPECGELFNYFLDCAKKMNTL